MDGWLTRKRIFADRPSQQLQFVVLSLSGQNNGERASFMLSALHCRKLKLITDPGG